MFVPGLLGGFVGEGAVQAAWPVQVVWYGWIFIIVMGCWSVWLLASRFLQVRRRARSNTPADLRGPPPSWRGEFLGPTLGLGLLCVFAGILVFEESSLTDQERAARAIEELGGEVEWQGNSIIKVDFSRPWLLTLGKVTMRDMTERRRLTDNALASLRPHLEALTELRELDLVGTRVTYKGLVHLQGLKHLKHLRLGSPSIWLPGSGGRLIPDDTEDLRRALPNTKIDWPTDYPSDYPFFPHLPPYHPS
jgi:hypothetical protein